MQPVLQMIQTSAAKADGASKPTVEDQAADADFSAVFDSLVPKGDTTPDLAKNKSPSLEQIDHAVADGSAHVAPTAEVDPEQRVDILPEFAPGETIESVDFEDVPPFAAGSKVFEGGGPSVPAEGVEDTLSRPKTTQRSDLADTAGLVPRASLGPADSVGHSRARPEGGAELRQTTVLSPADSVPDGPATAPPKNETMSNEPGPNMGQVSATNTATPPKILPGQTRSEQVSDARQMVVESAARPPTAEWPESTRAGRSEADLTQPSRPIVAATELAGTAEIQMSSTPISTPQERVEPVRPGRVDHPKSRSTPTASEAQRSPPVEGMIAPTSAKPLTVAVPEADLARPLRASPLPKITPSAAKPETPMPLTSQTGPQDSVVLQNVDDVASDTSKGDVPDGSVLRSDVRDVPAWPKRPFAETPGIPARSVIRAEPKKISLDQEVVSVSPLRPVASNRLQQEMFAEMTTSPVGSTEIAGQEASLSSSPVRSPAIGITASGQPAPLSVPNPVPPDTERRITPERSSLESVDIRLARPAGRDGLARMAYLNSASVVVGASQRSVATDRTVEDQPLTFLSESNPKDVALATAPNGAQAIESPRPIADLRQAQSISQQLMSAAKPLPEGTIEISMRPEELGRVKMNMTINDGALAVLMTVERPETADLMRRHLELFSQDFKSLGYTNVSFEFGGQERQERSEPAFATGEARAHERSDAEFGTPKDPTLQQAQPSAGLSGRVDIRL